MEYLKKLLKKSGWMSILESVVFIILGLILISNPEGAIKFVSYILGAIFIIVGLCKIINYYNAKGKNDFYNYDIVYGIMAIIIGIITICYSGAIASLLRIIIGVWIIYTALVRFNSSIKIRDISGNVWKYSAGIAIVMFICGLITLLNSGAITATIGTVMIIYSVMDIIESVIFMKNVKEIL